MHRIYIGASYKMEGDEMVQYLDLDPDFLPEHTSKFERAFEARIGSNKSEVAGKDFWFEDNFDAETYQTKVPFQVEQYILDLIDFDAARAVFFIEVDKPIEVAKADGIELVGEMLVEKYDFEK